MRLRATTAAVLLVPLVLAGCGHVRAQSALLRATVERVELSFASESEGELAVTLQVDPLRRSAGTFERVEWELWLDGRWFAAGTQALEVRIAERAPTEVRFTAPLHFRPTPLSTEPKRMDVGVRGVVIAASAPGDAERRLSFAGRLELTLAPAPQLEGEKGDRLLLD